MSCRVHRPSLQLPLALLLLLGEAQAGRPLVSEDAGVIARDHCELEGAASHLSGSGSQHGLQWGCGVGGDTQIAVKVGGAAGGIRTVELNGKTQWLSWGVSERPGGLALAWALDGARSPEHGLRHSLSSANLALSTPLGGYATLHANLGHTRDELAGRASTTWSLALEHDGVGAEQRLQPMLELFGNDHDSHPFLNAALRWAALPGRAFIDGSAGRELGGARARLVTLGFKLAF